MINHDIVVVEDLFIVVIHLDRAQALLRAAAAGAAGYIHGGFGVRHQHAHRAAQGHLGIAARHAARQGLRAQLAQEFAVHVLSEGGLKGHIPRVRGNHVAVHMDLGLVLIDAHGHAQGDGVGLLGQGHGRAGAQGVEVAGVLRGGGDIAQRDDLAHVHGGFMAGHGDAHGGGHLHLVLGIAAHAVQIGAGIVLDLAQALGGALAARVFALGGHVLVAQGIAGKAQVFAAAFAALSLLFVHPLVDLVGGGVILVIPAVGLAVKQLALEQVVALVLQLIGGLAHLVQVAGDIRAHGGGQGPGHILAVAAGVDLGAARHGQILLGLHVYGGGGDVHGHCRAHRGLAAHGIAAGAGFGNGVLARGEGQVALGGGGRAGQRGLDLVIQDIQRNGGVHGGILHGVDIRFAGEDVRAGDGGRVLRVVGFRVHGQRARGDIAIDHGGDSGIAVHHGEGRANAHRAALAVRSGGLAGEGIRIARLIYLHQDAGHILGRHGEGEHDLIAVLGGGQRHLMDLAIGGDVVDGIHLEALQLGLVDGNLNGIGDPGGQLAVLHGLVPAIHGDGNRAIGHLALGGVVLAEVDGVQPGDGMQILLRGHGDGSHLAAGRGGVGGLHIIFGFAVHGLGINLDFAGLFLALIVGIGPGGLVRARGDLPAVPGRDPDNVLVGGILCELRARVGLHLQLLAQVYGLSGFAACGVLFFLFACIGVGVGVAVAVQRRAGGGGHAPCLAGIHGHVSGHRHLRAAVHSGSGAGVQNGNSHAARDAHILGPRAGNGLGADDVLIGHVLGHQLHIQVGNQRFDGFVAQLGSGGVQRAAHHFLGRGHEIRIGDLVHHGGVIEHLILEGIGKVADKSVLLLVEGGGESGLDPHKCRAPC